MKMLEWLSAGKRGLFPIILALGALSGGAAWAQSVSVEVLDATVKDKRLSGANVIFQQSGEQSITAVTNAQGKAILNPHKPLKGDEMLIIKKTGFSDLVAKCPCDGLTYAMSPVLKGLDSVRIVLSWGSRPEDLDSHLVYAGNHVYFEAKAGAQAWLDVDDTDSYGPETITIDKKQYGTPYTYAVHDYSNQEADDLFLSKSGARVFVYVGQSLVKTYYVPSGIGDVWTVFRITEDGDIEDIDTLNGYGGSIGNLAKYIADNGGASQVVQVRGDTNAAKRNNTLGEKAYRDGNVDTAIDYFQTAIQQDPNFAAAYGNLGLAYRKLNRFAESIWASRKAISFASGENAGKTRAAAYYEIGKLYENNGDLENALRHYKRAKENNNAPVYDKAISRLDAAQRN
jgi:tetratricopeptide (TPR) repeat protein